jgi:hypothetical protein
VMDISGDLVLALRVRDDLLTFEHKSFWSCGAGRE